MTPTPSPADDAGKTYNQHQVLELIRTIAWEDLDLEVNGDSIRELLHGIYRAGGSDAAAGMAAIMEHMPGVDVHVVKLEED